MGCLKGLGWCALFFLAAIVGNSEVLLNLIPVWLLVVLFSMPWCFVALMAARNNNPKEDIIWKAK